MFAQVWADFDEIVLFLRGILANVAAVVAAKEYKRT